MQAFQSKTAGFVLGVMMAGGAVAQSTPATPSNSPGTRPTQPDSSSGQSPRGGGDSSAAAAAPGNGADPGSASSPHQRHVLKKKHAKKQPAGAPNGQ